MSPERARAAEAFLGAAGWGAARREALPGDASFRRYHRLFLDDRRAMLMDAPPDKEDVRPYVLIARLLGRLGFSAPAILAEEPAQGLLLIEDFGDDTYTRLLARGHDETRLYALAVDVLAELQRRFRPDDAAGIPAYDDERLLNETALLTDWFLPAATGGATHPDLRHAYLDAWRQAMPLGQAVPSTLVLRDYHIDNLMLVPGRAGLAACGLLDFQDAVIGPASYDLVSLLEDARRDIAPALAEAMYRRYEAALPVADRAAFAASYAVMGAQRSAKIVGIFTRLCVRDGKRTYLAHLPRVWRLLQQDLCHPALAPVRAWFDRHVPSDMRAIPRSLAA